MELTVTPPQRLELPNGFFDNNAYNIPAAEGFRWLNGVQFVLPTCGMPVILPIDPCDDSEPFPDPNGFTVGTAYPFRMAWAATCPKPLTSDTQRASFLREVQDYNLAGRHAAMGRGFWEGVVGGAHDVTGLVDVPVGNQLTNTNGVVSAIGKLMQAMGTTGAGTRGTIHMSQFVANVAASKQVIYRAGNQLRTVVGDFLVIADSGYTGTGPRDEDGDPIPVTDDVQYIYATGPVYYIMSDLKFVSTNPAEITNRRTNKYAYELDSYGLAFWDECQWFSVPVNLACDVFCPAV